MSKRKLPWQYAKAEYMTCGRMICTVCNTQITQGQYRFREAFDDRGFHAHAHRTCLPEGEQGHWVREEAEEVKRRSELRLYLNACKEFKEKWETTALDEEISDLDGMCHDQ